MTKKELRKLLENKPGYIKGWSAVNIANRFDMNLLTVRGVIKEVKADMQYANTVKVVTAGRDKNNVLVIGDLHEPFCLPEYLNFCKRQQIKHNCGTVIFIGDVVDNHYSSYHETSNQAMGANQELKVAKRKIKAWYKAFPNATVLIGNHDRLVARKAQTAGIADEWIRSYSEVLDTPGWTFTHAIEVHGIMYTHGEGGTARKKMKDEHQSQVGGHLHSQAYVEWSVGTNHRHFGMQVGCGIDHNSYAMAYGRSFKKPVISCGVVLNKGTFPMVIPMDL
tara:strand:+ start:3382 stop:4215 length:834 start_codon:yes stop_codon:yes gene_type:complete